VEEVHSSKTSLACLLDSLHTCNRRFSMDDRSTPDHTHTHLYVINNSVYDSASLCITGQTDTHTQQQLQSYTQRPFHGPLSGTTRVSRYLKKHSPTHHPDHHPSFISFFHLLQNLAACQLLPENRYYYYKLFWQLFLHLCILHLHIVHMVQRWCR